MKLEVYQIDAWREPDGSWTYNNWISIDFVEIDGYPTTRRILKTMRNKGYLRDESIYTVDSYLDFDGIWTILHVGTNEPLFDLKEVEDEDNPETHTKI